MKIFDIIILGIGIFLITLSLIIHDYHQHEKLNDIKHNLENQQKSLDILNENMQVLQDQNQQLLNYYKKFALIFNTLQNENPYNTIDELSEITNAIIMWSQCKNIDEKLLIALILIESNANHSAVSIAGARSVTQLMPYHYDNYITEPSVDDFVMLGTKYLSYLIKNYGEVGGLKRYLCGESNNKCINSNEASKYYWKIKNKQVRI